MQEYFTAKLELEELHKQESALIRQRCEIRDQLSVKEKAFKTLETQYYRTQCTHEIEHEGNIFLVNPEEVIQGRKLQIEWWTSQQTKGEGFPNCSEINSHRNDPIFMDIQYEPIREGEHGPLSHSPFSYVVVKKLKKETLWVEGLEYRNGTSVSKIEILSVFLDLIKKDKVFRVDDKGRCYMVDVEKRGNGTEESPLLVNSIENHREGTRVSAGGRILRDNISTETYYDCTFEKETNHV